MKTVNDIIASLSGDPVVLYKESLYWLITLAKQEACDQPVPSYSTEEIQQLVANNQITQGHADKLTQLGIVK